MRPFSYLRLINAGREFVTCDLEEPGEHVNTVVGRFKFNRLTADFSASWDFVDRPPLSVRIFEILRFLRFCKGL